MTTFADLGITPTKKGLVGHKIPLNQVLGKKMLITDFKIEQSTEKPGTECLHLQFEIGESKHVLFTGAINLIDMCKRVPKNRLPVTATIEKRENTYVFE